MGAKYSWEPDPMLAAMVGVVISIIVLIPAVCSVCFHLHLRRSERDGKVLVFLIIMERLGKSLYYHYSSIASCIIEKL